MNTQVILTMREQHKLKLVIDYEAGKIRAQRAAELLGISKRQFRRMVAAYRQRGIAAMAHGNRGKVPANRISEQVQQEILRLAKETYQDYNDCHFTEELAEQPEPIVVSRSTLRRIRRAAGQGSPRKRRAPEYRSRRERYPQAGMLLQTDGSRHDWLEGRGPWLTLVGMIDDANNEVPERFSGKKKMRLAISWCYNKSARAKVSHKLCTPTSIPSFRALASRRWIRSYPVNCRAPNLAAWWTNWASS